MTLRLWLVGTVMLAVVAAACTGEDPSGPGGDRGPSMTSVSPTSGGMAAPTGGTRGAMTYAGLPGEIVYQTVAGDHETSGSSDPMGRATT